MDNTMDLVEAGVVTLTIADDETKDAARETMEQVREQMVFMEAAVMVERKRDDKTIGLLEDARVKLARIEKKGRRYEAQVKLKQMSLLCGQLPRAALEKIFPEELWEAVLDRLEDKERYDVARSSDLFQDQAAKFKSVDLFPQVFPHLHKYLHETDVHRCRLTNKKWKDGIDNYLSRGCLEFEAQELSMEITPLPRTRNRGFCQLGFHNIDNNPKLRLFNETFKETEIVENDALAKYPFISRGLVFMEASLEHENIDHDFWTAARETLQVHGRKLWHLRLTFVHNIADFKMEWQLTCNLLHLTPNLKSLEICRRHRSNVSFDLLLWNLKMSHPQMRSMFSENSLPKLNDLSQLRTRKIPNSILSLLLKKYGGQLEKLDVCPFGSDELDFAGDTFFRKLTYFSYSALTTEEDWDKDVDFSTIGMRQDQCPLLEHLRLIVEFGPSDENVRNVSGVLDWASGFNKSVRHLELCFFTMRGPTKKVDAAVGMTTFLELPKLEVFSMLVHRVNLNTIDFLLPCRSLKQLTLIYFKKPILGGEQNVKRKKSAATVGDSSTRKEIIVFKDYTTKLYESNIWSIFPCLEIVKIEVDMVTPIPEFFQYHLASSKTRVYTRDGYIQNSKVT